MRALAAAILAAAITGCSTIGDGEIERGEAFAAAPEERGGGTAEGSEAPLSSGGGWTRWRGAAGDGQARGVSLPLEGVPDGKWPELWRVEVGDGISGPVVSGNTVFCHSRRGELEVVQAIDLRDGGTIWTLATSIPDWSQPFEAHAITGGPLATPAIGDGRLYTVGVHGRVQCIDIASGDLVFSVEPEKLQGAPSELRYGHAASPLVAAGRVIVGYSTEGKGRLVALDSATGAVAWRALDDTITYASPILVEIAGQPQIIVRTCDRLAGLRPEDGAVLWVHATDCGRFKPDCATPLVAGSVVYHTSVLHGTIAVRVARSSDGAWRAERVYRSGSLSCYTSSPLYHEGHLYGLHKDGKVACMDAATGVRRWIERDFGAHVSWIGFPRVGSLSADDDRRRAPAGDHALALDEDGNLALIRLSPAKYEPLRRWKVGEYTWAQPAASASGLVIRDGRDLVHLPYNAGFGGRVGGSGG